MSTHMLYIDRLDKVNHIMYPVVNVLSHRRWVGDQADVGHLNFVKISTHKGNSPWKLF